MQIERRFSTDLIGEHIKRFQHVGRVVVLTDTDFKPSADVDVIDVRTQRPDVLDHLRADVAIYAVDQDDLGPPFIQRLVDLRVKFYSLFICDPARWSHKDRIAREVIEAEFLHQTEQKFDKFDFGFGDAENICQALHVTRDIPGAYVEVGCFRGSSGRIALQYMKRAGIVRPSYFLDVFDGFTYPEARASADAIWVNSHETEGVAVVAERLRDADPKAIVLRNNIISDELPVDRIAVANLDVDQIEAVLAGLRKLAPLVAPGGILIVEDPGHTPFLIGAQTALQMFLSEPESKNFTPIYMASGQYFLLRR